MHHALLQRRLGEQPRWRTDGDLETNQLPAVVQLGFDQPFDLRRQLRAERRGDSHRRQVHRRHAQAHVRQ
ncbi:hypothetical protein XFF6970_150017 [Xanthomonas citri pv. fuscans]|nr:hypothetical protein XFF6970_150017 [Xanthomonas citri pv. fuscans]